MLVHNRRKCIFFYLPQVTAKKLKKEGEINWTVTVGCFRTVKARYSHCHMAPVMVISVNVSLSLDLGIKSRWG